MQGAQLQTQVIDLREVQQIPAGRVVEVVHVELWLPGGS